MPVPTSRILCGRRRFAMASIKVEASPRRAVMAGAEGFSRLDLDAEIVHAHKTAIMLAMQQKPSGADRCDSGERVGDPSGLLRRGRIPPAAASPSPAARLTRSRTWASSGAVLK